MDWSTYFENTKGLGVLATADAQGAPNMAVYARPHVTGSDTLAFIMRAKRSHENVQANPKAAYLFVEEGPGYRGWRLYLTKVREETDREKIDGLRRSTLEVCREGDDAKVALVHFHVDSVRPLIGDSVA